MRSVLNEVACPQLDRRVVVAIDEGTEDPYRRSLGSVLNVPTEMHFLLHAASGVRCFVDLGANIGHFTLSAALLDIPTVAVEALADNYLLLLQSLAANGMTNVVPLHVAASDHFGLVTMSGYGAWASVSEQPDGDTAAVPLDDVLGRLNIPPIDLIKVDVEGHEIPALRGLSRTLAAARPMLIFEGNNWTCRNAGGYGTLLREVAAFGYDLFVYNLDGTCRPVSATSVQDVVCVDYFAYPHDREQPLPRPAVRVPSVDERLARIEAEIDVGDPHRWHIAENIDAVHDELKAIVARDEAAALDGDPIARLSERIERIRERIAAYGVVAV